MFNLITEFYLTVLLLYQYINKNAICNTTKWCVL